MNTITKITIATALSLGLFTVQSCVQDDDYSVPSLECPQKKEANITIKDLLDQVSNKTLKVDDKGMVVEDLIVEGIVITSDESRNLPNTISFQDKASGATAGIQIELAERSVYGFYPIGSTVQVYLKGLKVAEDRGTIRIGTKLTGGQATTFDLDRMPKELREKVFIKTCDPIQTIAPKEVNSLAEALKPENVNTLVKINNVQFESPEVAQTYYPVGSTSTADNVKLVDKKGGKVDLRTNSSASFKDVELPTGSGEITVLVSKYNSSYQVYIRDTKDVNFDQPRFDVGGGQNPGGGNDTEAANLLFKGSDFNVWADFMSSINAKFGLKDYATSAVGLGRDDSNALQIKGTPAGNDYVFTAMLTNELPTNPKKITFYVKGKSGKSLSLNVNKSTTGFTPFNVGELANQPVTVSGAENNQYNGAIDTKGEWVLVTLNIEGLDIQKTVGNDLFSLKVGKEVAYDLIIDNIKID
ncbi:DUF5689 domain-containing protein [Empedobacter falsenii]|uniref:DUF5689 domain-containing protein n=1 Tax=Empedobacter falsenii TaxID=343874 RepID=UPI003A802576